MASWPLRSRTGHATALYRDKHENFGRPGFATTIWRDVSASTWPIFFIAREYLVFGDEAAEVTEQGSRFLTEFGVDVVAAGARRRHFCRSCLDWTERRPHIGGAIGAALANRCFALGWAERIKDSRAVIITAAGQQGFMDIFGIGAAYEAEAE